MVSDLSALLLLNCGISCHKASGTYQILKILRLKLVHGAEGSAHPRFVQTVSFYSVFCLFNVLRTSFVKNLQLIRCFKVLRIIYLNLF